MVGLGCKLKSPHPPEPAPNHDCVKIIVTIPRISHSEMTWQRPALLASNDCPPPSIPTAHACWTVLNCLFRHRPSGSCHVITAPLPSPGSKLSMVISLSPCPPGPLAQVSTHGGSSELWCGLCLTWSERRSPLSFTDVTGEAPEPVTLHEEAAQLTKSLMRDAFTASIVKSNNSL